MSKLLLTLRKRNNTNNKPFELDYTTSDKFKNDKINLENDNYYVLLDGIVLNKLELCQGDNWADFLIKKYEQAGECFFKEMKGSYYGFIYDKRLSKCVFFADHIGSKPVYYFKTNDEISFSNDYVFLVNYLKSKKRKVSLNQQAAYLLLSYGFVFEDITITNEISRLMVGNYAVIQGDKLTFNKFYQLNNTPIEISEEEALELLDDKFRTAVKLSFEKDIEYGYKHLVALSGGLESRMASWVANNLGYTNQLNMTFSQSNYLDETIAKQIAAYLKHEWIFKALDNGNFLMDIDDITKLTGGNVLYYGLAHGQSLSKFLNFDNLGLLHSGNLGGAIISSYSNVAKHKVFNIGDGAYSKSLLPRIKDLKFKEEYENEEIFKMYIRGFYAINQGNLATLQYTETCSPYCDIDFIDFALSIPLEYRVNHKLYKKWIMKKYPKAAYFVWEKERVPVNYPYKIKIKGKLIPISQIPAKILHRLGITQYGYDSPKNMNPLQYWYRTNEQLRAFMDSYFKDNIEKLNDYPELKKDCSDLFYSSKGSEKVQVLSLLSAVKFIKDHI